MRKKLLALAIGILGLGAGLFFTAAHPPFYASQATVSVTPGGEWDPASLAIMMTSGPVLAAATNQLHPNQTALAMRGDLQVTQVSRLFIVTAKGQDSAHAMALAAAVAKSFSDFLPTDDHVLKKGKPTRKRVEATVLTPADSGTAQRPLGSYAMTGALGLMIGLLLAFVVLRPSRREMRGGYRAAVRLIFGRGMIAADLLDLIDGLASEDEEKSHVHSDRDDQLAAWHSGRAESLRDLADHIDEAS